ncbi:MAG: hypothetical protein K1X79_11705 [Oligoflexia bacterium]|nr:hypothetical protein [Oligoflexia bacterium]
MEQGESDFLGSDKGGIITARGTGDGLVIRLDGRVEKSQLKDALVEFLSTRRGFLSGNDVAFEWVGVRPDEKFVEDLSQTLEAEFSIVVRASKLKESRPLESAPINSKVASVTTVGTKALSTTSGRSVSLFDGMEALGIQDPKKTVAEVPEIEERRSSPVNDSTLWDDPDTRLICTTLRSGQKIETEHSLVVLGDVNSGAELIAGGDIVVMGTLRGVAHAGAYDETGGGRVIVALDFQPTQLRIGMVISRGGGSDKKGAAPEIARVEGNMIVVEPYQARLVTNRRRL